MIPGDPKGVVLTNANIYQAVISNGLGVTEGFTGEEEWRFLAFMPLSHMYVLFPTETGAIADDPQLRAFP